MTQKKTLKRYVSDIDRVLQKFDKEHPQPSLSQQKEQKKYRRVHQLRDSANKSNSAKKNGKDFIL